MKALLFDEPFYIQRLSVKQTKMCITIPGKIVEVVDGEVCVLKVKMAGIVRPVVCMVDNPQVGDNVLVNSGTAVQKLSSEQVAEISHMWDSIMNELESPETEEVQGETQ